MLRKRSLQTRVKTCTENKNMPAEKTQQVNDLPKFVIRSINSTAEMSIRETVAVLHYDDPQYKDPAVRQGITNDALGGKVTADSWSVLYFALRVAEKSRIKPERIQPLRAALLAYVDKNPKPDSPALAAYMKERVEVLQGIDANQTGRVLRDAPTHADEQKHRPPEIKGPSPG